MKKCKLYLLMFFGPLVTLTFLGQLALSHMSDLGPDDAKKFTSQLKLNLGEIEKFGVVHFLTPQCSCSQVISDHLLERGRFKKDVANAFVVIVDDLEGEPWTKKFKERGFPVIQVRTDGDKESEMKDSLKGVPMLMIVDAFEKVRYLGGYSDNSITPFSKIDIADFLHRAESSDRTLASKPVIGCAVGQKYQALLDPLGLKYNRKGSLNGSSETTTQ